MSPRDRRAIAAGETVDMLAERVDHVIGVDPDRDRLTIALIDAATTGVVAETVVDADPEGYGQRCRLWLCTRLSVGACVGRRVWSIEGAGSYGAGFAVTAGDAGEQMVGFDRPEGRAAKDGAKSDRLDAVRAARELLGRDRWAQPRARGMREAVRGLLGCRNRAQVARTAAIKELRALVVTCRPELREQLRDLTVAPPPCRELTTRSKVTNCTTGAGPPCPRLRDTGRGGPNRRPCP